MLKAKSAGQKRRQRQTNLPAAMKENREINDAPSAGIQKPGTELSRKSDPRYFPSGKLVKAPDSRSGIPYLSFSAAMALIIKAIFRARFLMV